MFSSTVQSLGCPVPGLLELTLDTTVLTSTLSPTLERLLSFWNVLDCSPQDLVSTFGNEVVRRTGTLGLRRRIADL